MSMKYLMILCALLGASCVTSGDLRAIEDRMDAITADGIVTEDERDELQATIAAVAEDVEDRTEGVLGELAATGGITGLLTAFGLNAYRNATRRKDLAKVQNGTPGPV